MHHLKCKLYKNFAFLTSPISHTDPTASQPQTPGRALLAARRGAGEKQLPLGLAILQTQNSQSAATRRLLAGLPELRNEPAPPPPRAAGAAAPPPPPAPAPRSRPPGPAPPRAPPQRSVPCRSAPPPDPVCGGPPGGAPLAPGPAQPAAAIGWSGGVYSPARSGGRAWHRVTLSGPRRRRRGRPVRRVNGPERLQLEVGISGKRQKDPSRRERRTKPPLQHCS